MAEKLKFHFIKSPHFQEIPAHGAFGGIVPTGDKISVAFYSERNPIPTAIQHEVVDDGLGPELPDKRESKDGIVRMVHAVIYLDIDGAEALHTWLGAKISELKRTE